MTIPFTPARGSATGAAIRACSGAEASARLRWRNDGVVTQAERTQSIIFALGMLVAAGLYARAIASGVFDLPPRDRSRVRTLLVPLVLIFACIGIFPWSAIL